MISTFAFTSCFFSRWPSLGGCTVFSLNFSSAGRGSFIAGNAKRICTTELHFSGGRGGGGVQDMTLSLMGNLGTKCTSLILANLQAIAGSEKCCFVQ